jgi:aspartate/methionine/tyrosine aminotransferase
MRREIVHEGASQLKYEIREIVLFARQIASLGKQIRWENIGDPIQKGEAVAPWIKEIIAKLTQEELSYAYTDSQGDPKTRAFLADEVNRRNGVKITADDVIFFNGLGDAVAKLFGFLKREARVIGPSPAYSTHSSAEAAHSGYDHLTYALDANNNWLPDIEDLRNKVKYNDAIAGILLINPDNPTGIVYKKELLLEMVEIAREYDLFILADETYSNVVFPGVEWTPLSEVAGDVPCISMRSVSKEYPWPGARCGWIEVYNRTKDASFNTYIQSLISAKRLEVCSTTLPQKSIPEVMGNPLYGPHVRGRAAVFRARAEEAYRAMSNVPGLRIMMPQGALYMTALFEEGALNHKQSLPIKEDAVRRFVEPKTDGLALDKRFVYYLLASYGICVVPLTGFYSTLQGFRFTLLETDDAERAWIYRAIRDAAETYLNSSR